MTDQLSQTEREVQELATELADARCEANEAEERERVLRGALENAVEGLREMLPYVPDHFREKWDHDAYLTRAEAALVAAPGQPEGRERALEGALRQLLVSALPTRTDAERDAAVERALGLLQEQPDHGPGEPSEDSLRWLAVQLDHLSTLLSDPAEARQFLAWIRERIPVGESNG